MSDGRLTDRMKDEIAHLKETPLINYQLYNHLPMTTRNDESIQYKVLVVNFHFNNFNIFLKGTWNGKVDSPPIIEGWDDTE